MSEPLDALAPRSMLKDMKPVDVPMQTVMRTGAWRAFTTVMFLLAAVGVAMNTYLLTLYLSATDYAPSTETTAVATSVGLGLFAYLWLAVLVGVSWSRQLPHRTLAVLVGITALVLLGAVVAVTLYPAPDSVRAASPSIQVYSTSTAVLYIVTLLNCVTYAMYLS